MAPLQTRLSSKGQIVIPAATRRLLGLRPGQPFTVEVDPAGSRAIILREPDAADNDRRIAQGAAWLKQAGRSLVEDLHAERRRERTRERTRRS